MSILSILAPVRYPWTFNGPKNSKNRISRRFFIPLNKISSKIEGVTIFNPFPFKKYDLIHAFNRIPLGTTPYIIGFESHLPRAFGAENTKYFKWLSCSLASKRCRGIFAISEYAKRIMLRQHAGKEWYNDIEKKLFVRYPNIIIPQEDDQFNRDIAVPNLVFVGNHFLRKGGITVIKLAQLAEQKNIPIHIDVISSMQVGPMSWVDPLQGKYFEQYKYLISTLNNVTLHGALPNIKVLDILKKSHFSLLPTLSDTFGFSIIEGMANYVPAIATKQGAIPEFVEHKKNGFLIPLETNEVGDWIHINNSNRESDHYISIFDKTADDMAKSTMSFLELIRNENELYQSMRRNSRKTAENLFDSRQADLFWDRVYETV